jgi:hypothetical protein
MSLDAEYGSWQFDTAGPGMVALRVILADRASSVGTFLRSKKMVTKGQFKPDIKKFFDELGYTRTIDIIVMMKTTGLIMPSAKAIEFRLRFI